MNAILNLRRIFVSIMLLLAIAAGTAAAAQQRPIVFVHGNGDYAALWTTTIWRLYVRY
ncbi:hypothetical protein KKI24_06410 [bacterium]|nr:hypothetical protein [bacterium]